MNTDRHSKRKKILRCRLGVCFDKNFYIFSMINLGVGNRIKILSNNTLSLMRDLIKSAVQLQMVNLFIKSISIGRSGF